MAVSRRIFDLGGGGQVDASMMAVSDDEQAREDDKPGIKRWRP
jgi:hypothetical protein